MAIAATFSASLPSLAQSEDSVLPPARNQCRQGEETTFAPPFLLSASTNNEKNFENLRELTNAGEISGYIPRNSVVEMHPDSRYLVQRHQDRTKGAKRSPAQDINHTLIPIKVISVPSEAAEQNAREAKQYLSEAKGKVSARDQLPAKFAYSQTIGQGPRAVPGTEGLLSMEALRSIGEFTFVVTQDAPFLTIPGTNTTLKGRALRVARTPDGKYCVNHFCSKGDENKPGACMKNYVFEVLSPDLQTVEREFEADAKTLCCLMENLRPIHDRQLPSMMAIMNLAEKDMNLNLSNLEMIDSLGLVKMPMKDNGEGPFGSWHYLPDGGEQAKNWDALLNTTANCTFLKVLEEHQKRCTEPGCEIQWGDAFHLDGWGAHRGHDDGMCIDIRPLKTESNRAPVEWKRAQPQRRKKPTSAALSKNDITTYYDLNKTSQFVELLKAAGGEPIFFNDPAIHQRNPKTSGVGPLRGHDNHIHVCFKADNPQVQRVCRDGLGK